MKVNSNNSNRSPRPATSTGDRPAPNGSPHGDKKAKPSAIWQMGKMLENIFSHKGIFWIGIFGTIGCLTYNARFYARLLHSMGWWLAVAVLVGFAIAFTTTLFEVKPVIKKHSRKHALRRIYQAASAPSAVPDMNPATVANAQELLDRYRNVDREAESAETTTRWVMIAFEICVGVIFLGAIGVGLPALLALVMFAVSIFGCEKFILLAVRAHYEELPPQLAQQLDETLNNWGKFLTLKNLG